MSTPAIPIPRITLMAWSLPPREGLPRGGYGFIRRGGPVLDLGPTRLILFAVLRQPKRESRAVPGPALAPDRPAHRVDQVLGHRESVSVDSSFPVGTLL